jgi:hypothetical protein
MWRHCTFVNDFGISHDENGNVEDPTPWLREQFGASLLSVDRDAQLIFLNGDDFENWASTMNFCEGAFLPAFSNPPAMDFLKEFYWNNDYQFTSDTWPNALEVFLHMWDDVYWELYTPHRSYIDTLLRAHTGDPTLYTYFVDFDREYPDPSNEELRPAALSEQAE